MIALLKWRTTVKIPESISAAFVTLRQSRPSIMDELK